MSLARTLLILGAGAALLSAETLLIVHKQGNSVGFYDSQTGSTLATVPVGVKPHEVVLSQDGRLAYVTNYGLDRYTEDADGGNTISIIDLAKRELAGTIDLGNRHRPHGIERARSGLLYITTDRPSALHVVDPQKRAVVRTVEADLNLPHMLQLSDDERKAYVANSGNGTVTVVSLAKQPARPKHLKVGGIPMGFAMTKDGKRLFATTRTANLVAVIDTASDEIVQRIEIPGHPVRVRLTPDERHALVSLIDAGDLAVVDTRTYQVVHRSHAGTHAEGLAADAREGVGYISAQDDHKVIKFSLRDYRPLLDIPTGKRPDPIVVLPVVRRAASK